MTPPPPQRLLAPMLALLLALALAGARAPTASAFNPLKPVCGLAGWVSGVAGKVCGVLQHGDQLINGGKKLVTGHAGGAAKNLLGGASSGASSLGTRAAALIGLAAVGTWVLGGAKTALHDTATVLDKTTRPQLTTTWFSSTYWRMAGIAALLTLPFLFAAAVQALIHSDLGLLARASLGYLPLSLLAVSVAAPLTMLLLAASDEISAAVSSAAGGAGTRFLAQLGLVSGTLSVLSRSPFVAFFVGLLTVSAAVLLWVEMLMREAAVYIVVLMLPLAFSAFVWPARRIWAIRVVELLVALILSKFAIVAVLALGGAALGQRGSGGVGGMLAGLVLVVLAAAAPWALVRLLPMTELASAAAGQFRGEGWRMRGVHGAVDSAAGGAGDWAGSVMAGMRGQAQDAAEPAAEPGAARGESEKLTPRTPGGGSSEAAAADGRPEPEALVGAAAGGVGAAAGGVGAAPAGAAAGSVGGASAALAAPTQAGTEEPLPDLKERIRQAAGPTLELGPEALLPPPPQPSPQPKTRDESGSDADPGAQR
jgi:type IV secretion system protein TrbL